MLSMLIAAATASMLDDALHNCAKLDATACRQQLVAVADPLAHFYLGLLEQQLPEPDLDKAVLHYE